MANQTSVTAARLIEGYTLDAPGYTSSETSPLPAHLRVQGDLRNNTLYWKPTQSASEVNIRLARVSGCRVFLGERLAGQLSISLRGDNSTVYIGNDCEFAGLELRSRQEHDLIAIGNGVAVTGPGTWISGLRSTTDKTPHIIVGDCCLFSRDVLLRNTDGHPVYSLHNDGLLNATEKSIVIEPHAWMGERCSILKGVTIGAFARIALGAVVTKAVPRFAIAAGVPAQCRIEPDRYWSWEATPESRARARALVERFPPTDA